MSTKELISGILKGLQEGHCPSLFMAHQQLVVDKMDKIIICL